MYVSLQEDRGKEGTRSQRTCKKGLLGKGEHFSLDIYYLHLLQITDLATSLRALL